MKNALNRRAGVALSLILLWVLAAASGSAAMDPGDVQVHPAEVRKVTITAGKSVVVESRTVVKRISVAAPNIADVVVLTPRQAYINGKTPGITTVTFWDVKDNVSAIFDVDVVPDIARLRSELHETFPEEKELRVTSSNGSITLSGTVSSTTGLSQVLALAEPYALADKNGKGRITNLLQVGGVHQVMLEVRVSEMSRSLSQSLGINFNGVSSNGRQFGVSMLNNLSSTTGGVFGQAFQQRNPISGDILTIPPTTTGFPISPTTVTGNVNGMLRFLGNGATWTVLIDALKDQGLLKVLAEPTLIALSGKNANFLAGGEFPIPIPQPSASGSIIAIQYKPFGVALNFTPTVLSNNKISMQVAPEVSELDFSQAVSLQGYVIPSLTTRRVFTTIELADGQSFAIAGLLKDEVREEMQKYPLLGDIPILGALFRSSSFQKNETELVIIVTPHLVKPLDMQNQPLPTDWFVEPDDFEFFLLGKIVGRPGKHKLLTGAGLDGQFGHILP